MTGADLLNSDDASEYYWASVAAGELPFPEGLAKHDETKASGRRNKKVH